MKKVKKALNNEQRKLIHFTVPLLLSVIGYRFFLYFTPELEIIINGHHIHHLFSGAVILVFTIPFLLFNFKHKTKRNATVIAGFASGSILDQVLFLLFTDRSIEAYLSLNAFYASFIVTAAFLIFLIVLLASKRGY